MAVLNQAPFQIASLVATALDQNKLSGLSKMLKSIAEAVNAYGCILWQEADSPSGFLFPLAQWFQHGQASDLYYLPLANSVTGKAVLNQTPVNVLDINEDPEVYKEDSFLIRAGIKTFCSVPIKFLDKARGAVNLYRNVPEPFSENEVKQIEDLVSLVPALYEAIRDKVSLSLIGEINEVLHKAELLASDDPLPKQKMKKVIQAICDLVSDAFQCMEASIFLEDRLEEPEVYRLMATTWPYPKDFQKNTYQKEEDEHLTSWVLTRAEPVRIFDLDSFDRDVAVKEEVKRKYPGINWKDSLKIRLAVRRDRKLKASDRLPPLSFMAAPIVKGGSVRGVIRCSVTREGPFYFAEYELNLLKLIAAQISYYWSNWLSRREMQEENLLWQDLVKGVSELNSFAHEELSREEPDEHRIFRKALQVTASAIKGADILDVCLLNETTRMLGFEEMHGDAWNGGTEDEKRNRKETKFSVDERPPRSAGAHVYQTREVYVIPDVEVVKDYMRVFPDTKRMIAAPIRVKEKFYGLLDIRGTGQRDFPRHAKSIAEVLGQQLGLYHYLKNTIGELRKARAELSNRADELERLQEQQTQTFEDFKHQLKSPINQAYARMESFLKDELSKIQSALKDEASINKLESSLFAIRGLCRKAKRVTMSIGLFADLARMKPIKLKPSRLFYDELIKMLIEAAIDSQLILDPRRSITFHVERLGFEVLRSNEVEVDRDLLEQAVMSLLDNAGKYSFPGAQVRIHGGLTRGGRFHLSVANKGLQIHSNDVQQCRERGWRSDEAKWTTGEGSGIGLWIVDNIMKAHGGELVVVPTTMSYITEVKLIFPIK